MNEYTTTNIQPGGINILELWPAFIALIAALVVAVMHYLWTKAKTISEFRQKWINDLRDELSRYLALMVSPKDAESPFEVFQSWTRLQLLLNPKEPKHQKMMEHLEEIKLNYANYRRWTMENSSGNSTEQIDSVRDQIAELTSVIGALGQEILKEEWEVTKQMRLYPSCLLYTSPSPRD